MESVIEKHLKCSILRCNFTENSTTLNGGAVISINIDTSVVDSIFDNN
jgi:hypothetical protein